jgi:hypothetical protein
LRPNARQIREIADCDIPLAAAIDRSTSVCPGSSSSDRSPNYETSGVTSTRARIGSFAVSIS